MLIYNSQYNQQLTERLSVLSHRGHVTFAASCAQRLLPWVGHFRKEARLQPDQTADMALAEVWHWLDSGQNQAGRLQYWEQRLNPLLPDTERHSEESTSFCLNAFETIWDSLSLCECDGIEPDVAAARMTTDTIYLWVAYFGHADPQTPELLKPLLGKGLDFAERQQWSTGMAQHRLILGELIRQEQDINELTEDRDVSAATTQRIRDRSATAVVIPFPDDPIWQARAELATKEKRS